MTTELTKAAQQALHAFDADDGFALFMAMDAIRAALTQQATPEPAFDDCAKSPTGKHSESWFGNGDCEHCKTGAQNAPMAATPEPVGEPAHHRQAWVALAEACQRVAKAEGSSVDLASAIDRFSDVLMGDTRPDPVETEPVGEPYGWHYSNSQGASVLHLQPSCRLEADMDAAARWPAHHKCTPLFTRPAPGVPTLSKDQIREVFLSHGFTIKEGQTDLKPYVYDAAGALLKLAGAALAAQAKGGGTSYTYASKQATTCACCGEHKHTPLRIDSMGGYVCLTCIDKKLGSLLGEFGYEDEGLYFVQDTRSFVGNCPLWWRPNGGGYTTNLDEAGKFTREAAMKLHSNRDTDLPWLCSDINRLRRATIDAQYLPRSNEEQAEALAKGDA